MKRLIGILLVAVLAFAGAACSSSSDKASTSSDSSSGTSTAAADTSSGDTGTDTGSSTVTSKELQSKLLTADDLPAGFTAQPTSDTDTADSSGPLSCLSDFKKLKPEAKADVSFVQGADLPLIGENLGSFGGSGASSAYTSVTTALMGCSGDSDSGGTSIQEVPMTKFGDESSSYQGTVTINGVQVNVTFALVRKGDLVVLVGYFAQASPQQEAFEALVGKAVAKL